MTPQEAILARHFLCEYEHKNPIATVHAMGQPHCQRDGDPWPCDVQVLAATRSASAEVRAAAERLVNEYVVGVHYGASGIMGDILTVARAALATAPGEREAQ